MNSLGKAVQNTINMAAKKIREADAPLGYLTDSHIKWMKGYIYYVFGTKHVDFEILFNSTPRLITLYPKYSNDKIYNIYKWLWFKFKIWRLKNKKSPLLHPNFWPHVLDLEEWKIEIKRKR